MLINITLKNNKDNMIHLLSRGKDTKKIEDGIYETFHFNFDKELVNSDYKIVNNMKYKDLKIDKPYGVSDTYEGLGDIINKLKLSNKKYVLSYCIVYKSDQSSRGGFKWNAWGPYIGGKKISSEYLYNEKDIDSICVFAIYEISSGPGVYKTSKKKLNENAGPLNEESQVIPEKISKPKRTREKVVFKINEPKKEIKKAIDKRKVTKIM